jgi:glutaredoxin
MKKIFILALFVVLTASACTLGGGETVKVITPEEAKTKSLGFINDYLMNSGQTVEIKEVVDENGVYKVVVLMSDGQEIDSYLSKDGETFFPSGMNIQKFISDSEAGEDDSASAPSPEASLADIEKTAKPKVELFVMSHCPFGTQMEKGILPVLETLGSSIDFELKFNDYAMHGEVELKEQMLQYCIQKESPEKLAPYLQCFLADSSKSEECLTSTGVNKTKINSCVSATDKEYKVMELFADRNTWKSGRYPVFAIHEADNLKYGVTGSPSLVINGKKISANRDSASLLNTVCAGFENAPEACQTKLSSVSPSSGFGFGTAASATDASCE